MKWFDRLRARWSADDDLAEEIAQHLEEKIEELVARGLSRTDASWQARRELGNITLVKERSRDVWRSAVLSDLWIDVRYSWRFLRRAKTFAAASILTLALGIGANAAVFSILNAVLFRPLPFPDSDRLVSVQSRDIRGTPHPTLLSYPTFFDFRRSNRVFEQLASYRDEAFTLTDRAPAARVSGEIVSWDLFTVLGVAPALGRGFVAEEERPGTRVAVLSHDLWMARFGGDEGTVGRTISIDREPYVVVGIAPRGFTFPVGGRPVQVWVTLGRDSGSLNQRGARMLDSVARLKPGVSLARAQADMDVLAAAIVADHPDQNRNIASTYVRSELDRLVGDTRAPLMILLGAVALLLLIACANIANLLLARVMDRARELAMRIAIGASRARLIRQVLTENLVLAVAGSAVGILLAAIGVRLAAPFWPAGLPRATDIAVDWTVVVFCVCLALVTAVAIALPTVLRLSRADISESLKTGSWGNTPANEWARSGLVVAQVALGLMLLCAATIVLEGFRHLVQRDAGFQPDHLLSFAVSLPGEAYADGRQEIFMGQLLERLAGVPGVTAVAAGSPLPLSGDQMAIAFGIEGRPTAPSDRPTANMAIVTPGFFQTIGTPLEDGRGFTDRDDGRAPAVLIVNRAFADRFFPGERAIGKRIQPGAGPNNQVPLMREIVGIVGNARQSPLGVDREPIYYFPYRQLPWFPPAIIVRASGSPAVLAPAIRSVVAGLDRQVPVDDIVTMREVLSAAVAPPRMLTVLLGIFATIALILTCVGLYGVVSYAVSRQTREIGVRIALGATRRSITRGVVARAARLVAIGMVLGLAGSLAAGRVLASLLQHLPAHNLRVLSIACLTLAVCAATAALIPARRAASIDPLQALRAD
jgi:putative ABC transport system permease protein